MDKNGYNLELQTLLNEKQEKQIDDRGKQKKFSPVNPFSAMGDFIDFTLSNARRFYSSKKENLAAKGLKTIS